MGQSVAQRTGQAQGVGIVKGDYNLFGGKRQSVFWGFFARFIRTLLSVIRMIRQNRGRAVELFYQYQPRQHMGKHHRAKTNTLIGVV